MCLAITTTWHNTGITPEDITDLRPAQADHTGQPDKDPSPPARPPRRLTMSRRECISYDNVGPISPESIEGYRQFLAFRDTRSKYLFCYPI
jgi:hypothetical protein